MPSRRRFLQALGSSLGTAVGVGFYAWRVEPHWLEMVRRRLPIDRLPASLAGRTLVQLSDIHGAPASTTSTCLRRSAVSPISNPTSSC